MTTHIPQELYTLKKIVGDPRFEGFGGDAPSRLGRGSLYDDMTPGFEESDTNPKWMQIELRDRWQSPKVVGRVAPFNDYPCMALVYPVFSKRACEALRDFLEPNGELLPLRTAVGQYFFYNITTIVDALDRHRSKWDSSFDPPFTAATVDLFAFHSKKLAGLSIFRIHEMPMETIVTDQFVRRVQECGLNGLNFKRIWPFKSRADSRKAVGHQRKKKTDSKSLKLHTMVIMLALSGIKPNSSEKRAMKQLEDDLDAQLMVSTLDAPYWGSYEGLDTVNHEYRMFLSCPDVDRLEQKLGAWLRSLQWPAKVRIVKRYGNMFDEDANERDVKL